MALLGRRRAQGTAKPAARPVDGALDDLKLLVARGLVLQQRAHPPESLREAEFKVFSQNGEDGILQHLIHATRAAPDAFVEFGVGDYLESTTRYLLQGCNWRGLVLDGGAEDIESIRARDFHWRHDLTAVHAFVDRDNLDALLTRHGFTGPLGVLSIDIDGNDLWVWEALTAVEPVIVVVEYNSVFGATRAVAVPYDPAFQRTRAHASNLYWGASLAALCRLGETKGYAFVGSNAAGNNAFFVRRERLGSLRGLTAPEGWVDARFRESRGPRGELTYLSGDARRRAMAAMPLVDLERGGTLTVGDL